MEKKEKIVCCAIKFPQGTLESPENIVIGIDYDDCKSKDKYSELKSQDDFVNLIHKKTEGAK